MQAESAKKILILSYGPVPIPGQDKVEGGGLRCWGLATGLRANDANATIAVAFNEQYNKGELPKQHQFIDILTWNLSQIKDLVAEYDSVIVSYCMGELTTQVVEHIGPHQQLILDCYVPIYIEISARQSDDLEGEYNSFGREIGKWSDALKRGDVFLCASEPQKRFYQGVLAGLGRINPATYEDELILVVPYGIYRDKPVITDTPITKLLGGKKRKDKSKTLLWFGAIYPWFDLRDLVDAVEVVNKKVPTNLVIVGAKNPFNNHPDFVRRHDQLMEHIESKDEASRKNIIVQDWAPFDERANWYMDSDLVILINKIGPENELAWRTRLVDFLWADLPIITNGGDPLGENLLAHNAAVRLESVETNGMAKQLTGLLQDTSQLNSLKANVKDVKQTYYWDVVTSKLSDYIKNYVRPTDIMQFGYLESIEPAQMTVTGIAKRVAGKAKKVPAYYKKYGARSTYYTLRTSVLGQKRRLGIEEGNGVPGVAFVSHQLDMTGGPLVLLDLVEDFRKEHSRIPVSFHTFGPTASENIGRLNKLGIKPKIYTSRDIGITFNKGDTVVLNTVAYSDILRQELYRSLRTGTIKQLIWYVHEDEPDLIFSKAELKEIHDLIEQNKVVLYTPAKHSTQNYQRHLGSTHNIGVQYYRLHIPKQIRQTRTADDFDDINFVLPGMVGDGRKGQLPVFYALAAFKKQYYDVDPSKYRNFSLTFVGMADDFYSRQIDRHSVEALGSHLILHRALSHPKALEIIKQSNVTICYSIRECLPIFVFEGMAAGHPILRNDCSGLEEQLHKGKNGQLLDSANFDQLVTTFEQILNKQTTSNQELQKMSAASQAIEQDFEDSANFDHIIGAIVKSYGV